MKSLKKIVVGSIVCCALNLNAQDVHFSNLDFNNVYNSVASVGSSSSIVRITSLYRKQWPTIQNSYETLGFNSDFRIELGDNALGIGFISHRDQSGALNFTKLNLNGAIAYHQRISDNSYLSGAAQVGFTQHSIIESKAQWESQYNGTDFDPTLPSGENPLFQPFTNINIGAGLMWKYSQNYYRRSASPLQGLEIGVSTYYIGGKAIAYNGGEPEYMRYTFSGNGVFTLSNKYFKLLPAFLYQQKGKEREFVFGALLKMVIQDASKYTNNMKQLDISAGAYYRLPNDALIPTFNMTYGKFQLGLSYDVNTSKLIKATKSVGGMEFALRFLIN